MRDEEPFLAECLESLSAQTLADFEVIAVDDGSVDATPGILEANARGDSRFRVLRQEPAGMVAASERARAEARAPLLARMDADDVVLQERLELQVSPPSSRSTRASSASGSTTGLRSSPSNAPATSPHAHARRGVRGRRAGPRVRKLAAGLGLVEGTDFVAIA